MTFIPATPMTHAWARALAGDQRAKETAMRTAADIELPAALLQVTTGELEQFLAAESSEEAAAVAIAGQRSEDDDTRDKRSRRTEIERLSRRRRQATLRTMREEVKTLEAQFVGLMKKHKVQRQSSRQWRLPDADEMLELAATQDADLGGQVRRLRERFIETTLEADRLEQEQQELRQMLRVKQLLNFSLQSLATTFVCEWRDSIPLPLVDLEYQPLHREKYFSLMRDAYTELLAHDVQLAHEWPGGVCMGWCSRQFNSDSSDKFLTSLSKTFRGRAADALLRESWQLFTEEERLQKTFGDWSEGIRCRVLYELNEDIVVVYRTFQRRHVEKRFHSIVLTYRLQTEGGFVLGMRTIPVPSVQDSLRAPDKWSDVTMWMHFKQPTEPEAGVDVTFATAHPVPLPVPLSNLNMNFFTTVLRWENSTTTPVALTWT